MIAKYDQIGINYAELRRPDTRIAAAIQAALGRAETVLNVGAGTGSYEPVDRQVTAVEPSIEMIRQRSPSAAKVVQASAEDLPFDDDAFDASIAILTIHHWSNKEVGLHEMRRVTRGRIVLLTFDPSHRPWLIDYLPELATLDEAQMPVMSDYQRWLGAVKIARFWCRTTAGMASCTPTGAGPKCISTRAYGPAVRRSVQSAMPKRACRG
jgi:ubiquinone/menaquinone biosynthesis C-methylase UbiE